MKRVLEIFRGVRNLQLTNDESFGVAAVGKAKRQTAIVSQQKTIEQFYQYTAVIGHKDVGGVRVQYQVLWADSSVTWVDANNFTRDVGRSEAGSTNVITRYEKELALKVKRANSKARVSSHRAGDVWKYEDIRDHRDREVCGKMVRSEYEVVWNNGQTSWEPVTEFREDVERCEGKKSNVITEYEARVRQAQRDEKARRIKKPTILDAREFATWVETTQALEIDKSDRVRADERMAVLPRVPSLLPWSVRSPLTTAAGRMKMHDCLLYAKHWAPIHLRGLLKDEPYNILVAYFDFLSRLMARTMTAHEASALEADAGVVLSELELVLPVTEFTILVHALVHIPKQLAWFGPACTTWMFSYERSETYTI